MILVIFSKDRPLQLDAALGSFQRHCQDAARIKTVVLYKASHSRMISLYRQVAREHSTMDFVAEQNFRRDLLILLRGQRQIGFAVDDTIFVRDFSVQEIVSALENKSDALGFSLRLGRNTTYCYALDRAQALPAFECERGTCEFRWPSAEGDFGYPLEVSSSFYRGQQIVPLLEEMEFKNPNTLEDQLSRQSTRFQQSHPLLLCAGQSLAFSVPANKVQDVCDNRAGENPGQSAENLAELFAQGQRIAVEDFDDFTPNACHQVVEFRLTPAEPPVPRVSVVIPCYKQAHYLPEAMASVVAQTFSNWEILIVNDGSPDETGTVARALIKKYAGRKIRLIETKNEGPARARNAGIAAAAGAYILPLDADDKIEPVLLEKTVALLEAEPGIAIAYTDIAHFGGVEKVIQAAEYDFDKLRENNQLNYCSLYRREIWEKVGGYKMDMFCGYEDWDFWIGCGEQGFVARRIPGAFLQYRVKDSSHYTVALAHDKQLRAGIVLNHPGLYDDKKIREARTVWGQSPMPAPPGAPKVSVIVPTFNRPGRLEEALRSIEAQTMRDFEVIVVNDNGIDVQHVVAARDMEGRIVHLRHNVNKGLAAARNTGLRHARGRYIAYLDDDDIFLPDHLQTLANFLDSSGNRAAYTDAWCAHEELADGQYKIVKRETLYSADWDNDRILAQNFVPVLCFMHDRRAAIAAGGFDEQMTTHEDWDFWIRLSRLCTPVHVKQTTCEFRLRHDASSMTGGRRADFLRTAKIIFKKYRSQAAGKPEIRRQQRCALRHLKKEVGGGWFDSLASRLFRRRRAQ